MAANVPHGGIAVSRQLQREFREEFGKDVSYIPNGVSLPIEQPVPEDDPLEKFGLEPGNYLLNVGRLVPEKAIDQLLAAYPKVPGNVKLAIVGGSSHTDEYVERLNKLAAKDDRIVLAGPVYGAGTDRLFRNAMGYVMPSLLEGLPLALLEAISYGLPLVVSDIEPHLEVVGASGPGKRVFTAGDLDGLAAQLSDLVMHPSNGAAGRRRRADKGAARVLMGADRRPHRGAVPRAAHAPISGACTGPLTNQCSTDGPGSYEPGPSRFGDRRLGLLGQSQASPRRGTRAASQRSAIFWLAAAVGWVPSTVSFFGRASTPANWSTSSMVRSRIVLHCQRAEASVELDDLRLYPVARHESERAGPWSLAQTAAMPSSTVEMSQG